MTKAKKQTPQEIYQERKAREEAERNAYLPPGFVNHGNTCFMNSTLQGLLATRFLDELVHFEPVPAQAQTYSPIPIESWRSPLLTNGYGLGGIHEQEWVEGMPLGEAFLRVMLRAWDVQARQKRESLSPKEVLNAIGRKYDQYFDFAQQDAHEFLRQLLDAMRMEEMDIIKKRQPPLPKELRPRRHNVRPNSRPTSPAPARSPGFTSPLSVVKEASSSDGLQHLPEASQNGHSRPSDEEKLVTFPDMLFGGSLASILVCEKCKKISITHEDFNDLSLSIRPEDQERSSGPKARDKFKNFAKKLKIPRATHSERADSPTHAANPPPVTSPPPPQAEFKAIEVVRSASVPPSPMRRSADFQDGDDSGLLVAHYEPRRRSIDAPSAPSGLRTVFAAITDGYNSVSGGGTSALEGSAVSDETDVPIPPQESTADEQEQRGRVDFVEPDEKPARSGTKSGKDNWTKFSRRVSAVMGRASPVASRSKERGRSRRSSVDVAHAREGAALSPELKSASSTTLAPSLADAGTAPRTDGSPTTPMTAPTIVLQQPTPVVAARSPPLGISHPREKSPRPPKPTREEAAYLQALLADVAAPSSNPFSAFFPNSTQYSGSGSGANVEGQSRGQALWAGLKFTQLTNIEECLRMFTAIEALDGENRLGCRRCWKIANGVYRPRRSAMPEEDDEDEDGSDENKEEDNVLDTDPAANGQEERLATSHPLSSPISSDKSTFASSTASIAQSTSTANGDHNHGLDSLSTSVSSLTSDLSDGLGSKSSLPLSEPGTTVVHAVPTQSYQGLSIPSISTTPPFGNNIEEQADSISTPSPSNSDSLRTPVPHAVQGRHRDSLVPPQSSRPREYTSDDSDDSAAESDAGSINSSVRGGMSGSGGPSTLGSPAASPRGSKEALPLILAAGNAANANRPSIDRLLSATPPRSPSPLKAVPRAEQKIMRRALKRYLIAIPPPVLVIHLKRFQQIESKVPAISFTGSSFKKLDDYVAFPEYLDLGPYLAPRKEDFGLSPGVKKTKVPHTRKKGTVCMYRLYAVIEHIGNMLGGHYIAYTALPSGHTTTSYASTPASEKTSASVLDTGSASKPHADTKEPKSRQWAYISDTVVRLTTLDEVLKAKAYMCLYERV